MIMNVYLLKPVEASMNSSDWQASTFKGSVKIRAASEDCARDIATSYFDITVGKTALGQPTPGKPWNNAKLVHCQKIGEDDSTEEGILEPENYE
jgi:hypothetical protein